jgi:thiosulfate/3-mercaptopyruvate sulfurtransferase
VCHAIEYTSCDGCHLAISETTGNPFYQTEADYLTFLIGKNPLASFERPYKYVPVRHIPVDQETFAFYGENLLDEFNNLETWKYTTPHNIQLRTPQTESCNACHGNPDLFLTADKVKPEELEANRDVIVDEIPVPLLSGEQFR